MREMSGLFIALGFINFILTSYRCLIPMNLLNLQLNFQSFLKRKKHLFLFKRRG